MKDEQGHDYKKLNETKAGDLVKIDDSFNCMRQGLHQVCDDNLSAQPGGRLYLRCDHGAHYLCGQVAVDVDNDSLIGIYPNV